ncbi:glutamyl-tRNA reductase [Pseudonocardia sp. T1-2H]|uniref:glutamyl-tRNA reductase n=1 Tax=Pseudonocardia sp. T1-2H TaxID=3128899 RepID=UPI00310169A8
MTIVNIGLSHRIAPAEVLEKLVVPSTQLRDVVARLHAVPAIDEVLVLSTCNRIEVYAGTQGPVEQVTRAVADLAAARGRIPVDEILRIARVRVGASAVEHLFSVACGLDSMAVGEDQIVAQIKAAARAAAEAGAIGPVVTGLIDAALRASKRARTETTISTAGISLARAGIELAHAHLGGLAARRAVVLGTGAVGRLAARLLREGGVGELSVASRSEAGAAGAAAAVHATALRAVDVPAVLADSDLLVTATGCAVPVVLAEQVRASRERAAGRPLFVLDLGMPPDVEPAVGRLSGVTLVDIDALGRHLAEREVPDEIPRVRAIVAAEVASYVERQSQAAAAPFIGAMHSHVRQLAEVELLRMHSRLPGLSDHQRAETAATVYRIVRQFLHRPTVRAKQLSTDPEGSVYLEALRQLFDHSVSEAKA